MLREGAVTTPRFVARRGDAKRAVTGLPAPATDWTLALCQQYISDSGHLCSDNSPEHLRYKG